MTHIDPHALRKAFGRFMTGVTIVATRDASGAPVGFTANSFSSVSLDPPLLLVCPGKFMSNYDAFTSSTHFTVSVLADGQQDVSNIFASFQGDRFAQVEHHLDANNVPVIDEAIATFSCKTHHVLEAGDHSILIGEVQAFTEVTGAGLGYADGRYVSLGLERDALGATRRQVICGAVIETAGRILLENTSEGYRPPHIIGSNRAQLRQELQDGMAERGVWIALGAVYSVFDDATTHSAYILATAEDVPPVGLEAIDIEDLPNLTYTSPSIADMMARFALESRTGNFSLYLGDAQSGETHAPTHRS